MEASPQSTVKSALCDCGLRAVVRTSHTPSNPDRSFFTCPLSKRRTCWMTLARCRCWIRHEHYHYYAAPLGSSLLSTISRHGLRLFGLILKNHGRKGCQFFKWCDIYAAEVREQELVNLVAQLQLKVTELREEKIKVATTQQTNLYEQPSSSMGCTACVSCDGNLARQLKVIEERLTQSRDFLDC